MHEHFADRLLVAAELPLPTVLRRAVTLRSGMPSYDVHCRLPSGGVLRARAYENVSAAAAEQVAQILGVTLRPEYDEVEDLDA